MEKITETYSKANPNINTITSTNTSTYTNTITNTNGKTNKYKKRNRNTKKVQKYKIQHPQKRIQMPIHKQIKV